MGEEHCIGLACDRRSGSVDNGNHLGALVPRVSDRHDRIHGFSGLGNGHDEGLFADDGVAVAELVGEFDLDRNAAPVFNSVARNLPRIGRGAAGDDDHLVGAPQDVLGNAHLIQG